MVCGYCGDKNHNISNCPYDNELVNLLYSSENIDFSSLSYKVLRKIASRTLNKTCLSKYKLVEIFNKIKKDHDNKQKTCNHSEECAICYETIGKTNVCTTACGHTFCMTCMLKMVRNGSSSSNSCPMCRAPLLETIHNTYSLINAIPNNFNSFIDTINSNIYHQEEYIEDDTNNGIRIDPDELIAPRELFPNEPNNIDFIVNSDNDFANIDNSIIYNNDEYLVNNDEYINNSVDFYDSVYEYIDNNNNNLTNSELNAVNILENLRNIENRRLTRNEEEYRVRQDHINEMHIIERG